MQESDDHGGHGNNSNSSNNNKMKRNGSKAMIAAEVGYVICRDTTTAGTPGTCTFIH